MERLRWSDAWIFFAVALANSSGQSSLAHVLGAADGVQHAIPTTAELDGAIGRLGRAGLLTWSEDDFRLTTAGQRLFDETMKTAGRTMRDAQDALERALDATAWDPTYDPATARGGEAAVITGEAVAAATKAYRRMLGRRG